MCTFSFYFLSRPLPSLSLLRCQVLNSQCTVYESDLSKSIWPHDFSTLRIQVIESISAIMGGLPIKQGKSVSQIEPEL